MTTVLSVASAEPSGESTTPTATPRRGWPRRLRRHWLAATVIAAGIVLRVLVMIAYPRAFWVQGDSQEYVATAFNHIAGYTRPSGYALFLTPLVWFRSTAGILVVQHLLGIGVVAISYVFLYRRGVNRFVAAVAVAPMALEARLIALEHYLLAESFFVALLMAALILLLWRDRPGVRTVAAVGLMLALAAVTRSVAITLIPGVALYLAIRRVGWRQFVAFAVAATLGLGLYVGWFYASHHEIALTGYGGKFLWARTTTFMDCSKLSLTPQEMKICPKEPIGQRPEPAVYMWTATSVVEYTGPGSDAIYGSVARKALLGQPGAYVAIIATGVWDLMPPGLPPGTGLCDYERYQFPTSEPGPCIDRYLAPANPRTRHYVGDISQLRGPLLAPLNWYSRIAILPGGVSGAAFVFAVVAAFVRPRRSSLRAMLDPLLLSGIAFGMIVLSVAAAEPDTRYEAPSLPVAMLGAALAWTRLRDVTRSEPIAPS
jgi:hypothetical protein